MELHTLPKINTKKTKRLGLGHGSGRGKTSGRGTKGQKARRKIPLHFEGGALPLIKRLPFLRGKAKNRSFQNKPEIIHIADINHLPKDTVIDIKKVIELGLVTEKNAKKYGVKLLADGDITNPVQVKIPVSRTAAAKIEKTGGSIIEIHE